MLTKFNNCFPFAEFPLILFPNRPIPPPPPSSSFKYRYLLSVSKSILAGTVSRGNAMSLSHVASWHGMAVRAGTPYLSLPPPRNAPRSAPRHSPHDPRPQTSFQEPIQPLGTVLSYSGVPTVSDSWGFPCLELIYNFKNHFWWNFFFSLSVEWGQVCCRPFSWANGAEVVFTAFAPTYTPECQVSTTVICFPQTLGRDIHHQATAWNEDFQPCIFHSPW